MFKAAERLAKQGVKGRRGPKRKAPSRQDDYNNAENEYPDEHGSKPVRKKAQVVNEPTQEMSKIIVLSYV